MGSNASGDPRVTYYRTWSYTGTILESLGVFFLESTSAQCVCVCWIFRYIAQIYSQASFNNIWRGKKRPENPEIPSSGPVTTLELFRVFRFVFLGLISAQGVWFLLNLPLYRLNLFSGGL